jgi:DNA-binding MarR family transcriptional regulator
MEAIRRRLTQVATRLEGKFITALARVSFLLIDKKLADAVLFFAITQICHGVTMANRSMKLIDVHPEHTRTRVFILFVQTADAVVKYADASFYKAGLSVIKFIVLRVLAANGGTMTPSEIAEWTLRERHSITTLVDRMRKDGLVKTQPHGTDKRSINVILTDKGREVLRQATVVAREIVNQAMLSISEDDTLRFEESLRVLRQNAHHGLAHVTKRSQPRLG